MQHNHWQYTSVSVKWTMSFVTHREVVTDVHEISLRPHVLLYRIHRDVWNSLFSLIDRQIETCKKVRIYAQNWESTRQKTSKQRLSNHKIFLNHPRLLQNGMDASRTMLESLPVQRNQLQFCCQFFIFQPKAIFSRLLLTFTNGKYTVRKKEEGSYRERKVCHEALNFLFAIDIWMNEWRYAIEIFEVQTSGLTLQRKETRLIPPFTNGADILAANAAIFAASLSILRNEIF